MFNPPIDSQEGRGCRFVIDIDDSEFVAEKRN